MRKKKMIKIDGNKLKYAVNKRGINLRTASVMILRNKNYLSNCVLTEEISADAIIKLKKECDIDLEEYSLNENEPESEEDFFQYLYETIYNATHNDKDFYEKLYDTIYKATYDAVKHAWEDD